jgi:CBS domain-containing protein
VNIGRIYHPGAPFAAPDQSLRRAASEMRSGRVSCLPIMSDGELVGVLTERDVLEAVARGVSPSEARVGDYMNDGDVTVSLEDDSGVAAARMLAIGCRHLPVMDRGRLVGIVSARDIFPGSAPRDAGRMMVG